MSWAQLSSLPWETRMPTTRLTQQASPISSWRPSSHLTRHLGLSLRLSSVVSANTSFYHQIQNSPGWHICPHWPGEVRLRHRRELRLFHFLTRTGHSQGTGIKVITLKKVKMELFLHLTRAPPLGASCLVASVFLQRGTGSELPSLGYAEPPACLSTFHDYRQGALAQLPSTWYACLSILHFDLS